MTTTPHPSPLRLFVGTDLPLKSGHSGPLPDAAAKHAQVRRVQPGELLQLFNGRGVECAARVVAMGRHQVEVEVGAPVALLPELPLAVSLALVVPANERMDSLVEKATELGARGIQPLMSSRSVLRLQGERASRRQAHWQGVAVAAAEQSGRAWVPDIAPVAALQDWLAGLPSTPADGAQARWLLSLGDGARPPVRPLGCQSLLTLSGPEGGLSADEESAATRAGFLHISLGPRVLRADTAPLALLAWLGIAMLE